jgi:hypothetical protein
MTGVIVETGSKRTFASAIDWPGWSRSGRTEGDALSALVSYAPRYAKVARRARLKFQEPRDPPDLEISSRVRGNATTDFGAPGMEAPTDREPMEEAELQRQVALLKAGWATLDEAAASAQGIELAKGPRGGGRDLEKIVEHVIGAEEAYLGQLGARPPKATGTPAEISERLRAAIIDALGERTRGVPLSNPRATRNPWSPRYFVRRTAWHALDHAWEIQDRSR